MAKNDKNETLIRFRLDEYRIQRVVERQTIQALTGEYVYETWEEVVERLQVEIERIQKRIADERKAAAEETARRKAEQKVADEHKAAAKAARKALLDIVQNGSNEVARVEAAASALLLGGER
jgi:hypothetical protein